MMEMQAFLRSKGKCNELETFSKTLHNMSLLNRWITDSLGQKQFLINPLGN